MKPVRYKIGLQKISRECRRAAVFSILSGMFCDANGDANGFECTGAGRICAAFPGEPE